MINKIKKNFRQLYRNILKIMPTKLALNIENFRGYHKFINFKNPRYFGEKIQWLKLYGNLEKYTDYVDKYKVREYVKKIIGENYLIPLLGVYNKVNEIDYDKLPNRFVLKLNTGSGYNIIINNKSKYKFNNINKKLNKWLKEDYYKMKKEPQYKNIEKKIICEKYISDSNNELLDYKFFCFNGVPKFLKVDYDRYTKHKVNFYDMEWNLLDLKEGDFQNYNCKVNKPKNFNEMVSIVKKLCKQFDFVRVDLYNVNGKIYFGELTFTPAAGVNPFKPINEDLKIASYVHTLNLEKTKKILYFGSIGFISKRLDGVTVKSKCLNDYLLSQEIVLRTIDVDNYKKRFIKIFLESIKNMFWCDKIVICSSSKGASILLSFLNKIRCKKEIYYFVAGGTLADSIENKIYNIKNYLGLKAIYVESKDMYNKLVKLGLKNVDVIPNFRKFSNFQNNYINDGTIKFVFYGRIIKEKGIEHAIDLVNKLTQQDKIKCSLHIYGQISLEYLKEIKKKFGNNISYQGVIVPNGINEYEILSKYDIFLFPTEWPGEGLPGALIDSYISGLAVVVSNWKYASEYVLNGKNGVIFDYKNYEDMYDKTLQLIQSNKIDEYKRESLKLSKNYLVDNLLKDFIKKLR